MSMSLSKSLRNIVKPKETLKSLHPLIEQNDIETLRFSFKDILTQPKKIALYLNNDRDADEDLPIHKAMRSNNVEIVKLFLDFYKKNPNLVNINVGDRVGYTPLHLLVSNNELPESHLLIKELLSEFTDLKPDVVNQDKNNVLHYLCAKYNNPHAPEIGETIIKKAGPSIVNLTNRHGETALHKAIFNSSARLLLVDMLISHGADVNKLNDKGESCLHYAVRLGRRDVINTLVLSGANIYDKGNENKTPLELSVQIGNKTIKDHLSRIEALMSWGNREEIDREIIVSFIKEEVYLDLIIDLDDDMLDSLKINKIGLRKKLLEAASRLKKKSPSSSDLNSNLIVETPLISAKLRSPLDEDSLDVEECDSLTTLEADKLKGDLRTYKEGIITQDIEWIVSSDLEFLRKLGEGASGKVYKGLFKGKDCAIKVLKSRGDVNEFKKEFYIISSVKSPHIVHFYGACLTPQIAMVMEYCSGGSLYDILLPDSRIIDWTTFFKMSKQIVNAVHALHSWTPQVLHRDLKSMNLLVNDKEDLFLADFGLSRFETESNADTLMKTCGTVTYCAPEILAGRSKYTTKCDVYSIAFILWEILVKVLTGVYQRPYCEYPELVRDIQFLKPICDDHLRPTLPNECPNEIRMLIQQSWSPIMETRPSTSVLIDMINNANNVYLNNKAKWDSLRYTK